MYLRITVNGKRSEIGISREIEPINWDHRKERARGTKKDAREINAHIENISTKIRALQSKFEKEDIPYTSEKLKDEFLVRGSSSKMLEEVIEEHNRKMENEVGSENGFSANTVRTWKSTYSHSNSDIDWLTLIQKVQRFKDLPELNQRVKTNSLYIRLKFYAAD